MLLRKGGYHENRQYINSVSAVMKADENGNHKQAYVNAQAKRDELAALLPPELWTELFKA